VGHAKARGPTPHTRGVTALSVTVRKSVATEEVKVYVTPAVKLTTEYSLVKAQVVIACGVPLQAGVKVVPGYCPKVATVHCEKRFGLILAISKRPNTFILNRYVFIHAKIWGFNYLFSGFKHLLYNS
jgi:hypothetical protein